MDANPLARFSWLADAPLFIDALQIERFYDAIVNPTYVEGATSLTVANTGEVSYGSEVGGKGTLSFGGGLLQLFGLGKADAEVSGKVQGGKREGQSDGRQTQWLPIRTPQRQLALLVYHYLTEIPDRVVEFSGGTDIEYLRKADPETPCPRALVVLDLPSAKGATTKNVAPTRLIPMAAETDRVLELCPLLAAKQNDRVWRSFMGGDFSAIGDILARLPNAERQVADGTVTLRFPERLSDDQRRQLEMDRLTAEYNSRDAMLSVEEGCSGHRIRWIDFRLPTTNKGPHNTIHLHFCPNGEFDTGVFAYSLVHRGYLNGLRIVGTLKAGPDINVLAVYEK